MITREEAKDEFWRVSKSGGYTGVFERAFNIKFNDVIKMPYHGSEFDKFIDKIYDNIEKPKLCNTCTRDHCGCSIQDSILQVEPDATFDTFGCVHHEFNALLTEPSKHSTIQQH